MCLGRSCLLVENSARELDEDWVLVSIPAEEHGCSIDSILAMRPFDCTLGKGVCVNEALQYDCLRLVATSSVNNHSIVCPVHKCHDGEVSCLRW